MEGRGLERDVKGLAGSGGSGKEETKPRSQKEGQMRFKEVRGQFPERKAGKG